LADYRISVDTNIDTGKLDAFEKRIKALDSKKLDIKINVDASDISKQVTSQINKALGTGSSKKMAAKIGIDIDSNEIVKKANDAFTEIKNQTGKISTDIFSGEAYRDNVREIDKTVKEINRLSVNPDVNAEQLKELNEYLDVLIAKKKRADDIEIDIFDGLDTTKAREFAVELERVDHQLSMIQQKNIDAGVAKSLSQQAKEAREIYGQISNLNNELARSQKNLIGLDKNSLQYDEELKNVRQLESEIDGLKTKLSGFDSSITGKMFDELDASAQKLARNLNTLEAKNIDLGIAEEIKQEEAKTKAALDDLANTYKRIMNLSKQQASLDIDSSEYKVLEFEMDRLAQKAVELRSKIDGPLPDSFLDNFAEDSARTRAEIDRTTAKIEDASRKRANAFSTKINNGALNAEFEKIDTRIDKLTNKTPELNRAYEQFTKLRSELGRVYSEYQQTGNIDALLKFQNRYNETLTATKNQLKTVEEQQKRVNSEIKNQANLTKFESSKQTLDLQIQSWLKSNSAAAADFGDQLENIRTRIRDCNDSASLNNLKSEFQQVKLEAQIADKATMTFGDRLKNQLREYASYVGIAGVFMAGSQAVRMMAQNVLEVDTAMTGLYRVTDMTTAQYDKLYSDMIASSKEYGTTLTDTINATSDWVRAGYDADTALQLADITAMYQHISDLDYDEASENLLTAYNGFKDSFNEEFGGDVVASVNHIADAFNDLDNKYSITSAGLGEGLARSASALELAGNTFEEAAA